MAHRRNPAWRRRAVCAAVALAGSALLWHPVESEAHIYSEGVELHRPDMDMTPYVGNNAEQQICYEPDVEYVDHTVLAIEGGHVPTPAQCQNLCVRYNECFHWTWESATRNCYLKDATALFSRQKNYDTRNKISGPKWCMMPFPPRCYEVDVAYEGHEVTKNPLPNVVSALDCHRLCIEVEGCRYWTWTADARTCEVKSVNALQGWRRSFETIGKISGMKSCGLCTEIGTDYYGHDIRRVETKNIVSSEHCRDLCIKDKNCFFWTWVSNWNNCYLKGPTALEAWRRDDETTQSLVSGSKFCPMDRDLRLASLSRSPFMYPAFYLHNPPPCYEIGVDYAGHDLEAVDADDLLYVQDCQHRCKTRDGCVYFTFDTESKVCYLKGGGALHNWTKDHTTSHLISGPQECPCPGV
ncbi:PAN/Apple domain-containing protein [Besnoitia besnoiti]|uniref:PAN/Apple domain-containing protein n=1 Tax=Besnoitia besnoiti TaxID=94643 RepID=A0A2A9MH57_BESBE|nr:PAN/Apple domain-containing protein [Besnoitia besnoiti]PFH34742.1 PAN/Apple domain-containing protein [Besnoitia besnoiti]